MNSPLQPEQPARQHRLRVSRIDRLHRLLRRELIQTASRSSTHTDLWLARIVKVEGRTGRGFIQFHRASILTTAHGGSLFWDSSSNPPAGQEGGLEGTPGWGRAGTRKAPARNEAMGA